MFVRLSSSEVSRLKKYSRKLPLPLLGSLVYSSSSSSFGTITSFHLKSACSYHPRIFFLFLSLLYRLTVSPLSPRQLRHIYAHIARGTNVVEHFEAQEKRLRMQRRYTKTLRSLAIMQRSSTATSYSVRKSRQRRMLDVNITRTKFPAPTQRNVAARLPLLR